MKRMIIVALIISLLLSACAGKEVPPTPNSETLIASISSEPAALTEPNGGNSAILPEETPAGLSGWTKAKKPVLAEIEQAEYWMPVFKYLTRCYRDVFLRDENPIKNDWLYSVDIQLARLGVEVPGGVLSYEQYAELAELFWGAPAATESMEHILGVTESDAIIDPQTRTIKMDAENLSLINTEQYTVQSIEPHGGVDNVTLTMLFSINPQEPYRIITYELFWDEWAGYLPKAVSWEYTPTNRTSVEGDAELFPMLWGKKAIPDYDGAHMLEYNKSHMTAIGSTVYRFAPDGNSLFADTIDLKTLEQRKKVPVCQMDSAVRGVLPRNDGIILYTDGTVVRLGKDLREQIRKQIPEAVKQKDITNTLFQSDLDYMAFSTQDGLYLCELTDGAQPRLLREHRKGETIVDGDYLYPLEFLDGDRLYVAAGMWEASAGYYLILDYQGNELERLDYYTSGMISGGFHSNNAEWAIYYQNENTYAYNFVTGAKQEASWLEYQYGGQCSDLSDPARPSRWYISIPSDFREPERTDFMLADFDSKTLTRLPLIVHGGMGYILAVSEARQILFVYSYRGEGNFGVLTVE